MRAFQLDECANSKRLRRQCKKDGVVDVHSFPKRIRNKSIKDPEVLRWLADLDTPLITTDGGLTTEHVSDVPDSHPGIVILRSAARPTLTLRDIQALLREFKNRLTRWHEIDISGSIVEIWKANEFDVRVTRIKSGQVVSETVMRYQDKEWPDRFTLAVSRGDSGGQSGPLPAK